MRRKRPIYLQKETIISAERDLYICRKRPIYLQKETYTSEGKDLYISRKHGIHISYKSLYLEDRDYFTTVCVAVCCSVAEYTCHIPKSLFRG